MDYNQNSENREVKESWIKRRNSVSRRLSSDNIGLVSSQQVTVHVNPRVGVAAAWKQYSDEDVVFHDAIECGPFRPRETSSVPTGPTCSYVTKEQVDKHKNASIPQTQDIFASSSSSSMTSSSSSKSSRPLCKRVSSIESRKYNSFRDTGSTPPIPAPRFKTADLPSPTRIESNQTLQHALEEKKQQGDEPGEKGKERKKSDENLSWTELQKRISAMKDLENDKPPEKIPADCEMSVDSKDQPGSDNEAREPCPQLNPEKSDAISQNQSNIPKAPIIPPAIDLKVDANTASTSKKPNMLKFRTIASDVAQQIRILAAIRKLKKVGQLPTKKKTSVVTPKIGLMCEMLETHNPHKMDLSKADSDQQLLEQPEEVTDICGGKPEPQEIDIERKYEDASPSINIIHGDSKVHFESPDVTRYAEDRLLEEIDLELALPSGRLIKTKSSVVSLNNDIPDDQLIEHFAKTGRFVRDLYAKDQLSDIILGVGNCTFSAHMVVLACHSDYFSEIFLHKKKSFDDNKVLTLDPDITPFALQLVLEYMYSGRLRADHDNVMEVLNATTLLRISVLEEHCMRALSDMSLSELLLVLQASMKQQFVHSENEETQWKRVASGFLEVVTSDQFLQASLDCVNRLLSRDDLAVSSEADVAFAAVKWTENSKGEREDYLHRVMACVRWPLLTIPEILGVAHMADFLLKDDRIRKYLMESIWYRSCMDQNTACDIELTIPTPRIPDTVRQEDAEVNSEPGGDVGLTKQCSLRTVLEDIDLPRTSRTPSIHPTDTSPPPTPGSAPNLQSLCILAFGGYNPLSTSGRFPGQAVERYDVRGNYWEPFSTLPEPLAHHAVALLAGHVFITGGCSAGKNEVSDKMSTNSVYLFDYKNLTWDKGPAMLECRAHHCLASVCGVLYAIGGVDQHGRILSSVERYNPGSEEWEAGPPMSCARQKAAVAVVNGTILVAGGCGGDNPQTSKDLDSVEVLDPLINSWQMASTSLSDPRCSACMTTVDGKLYICGGVRVDPVTGEPRFVDTLDVYDDLEDIWWTVNKLSLPRYDAGCAAIGSRLYIIGGISPEDKKATRSLECYNAAKGIWESGMENLHMCEAGARCISLP